MFPSQPMTNETSELIPSAGPKHDLWQIDSGMCLLTRFESDGRNWLKKSLKESLLNNDSCRHQLHKEAEMGMIVSNDTAYVVRYYGFIDTQDECSILMDFIEGETLAETLEKEPEYFHNSKNTRRFLNQLLDGLQAIHHEQVVHLDLKPSNFMITRVNHEVRIIDLGFCYCGAWQTSMGMTSGYASPEQTDGSLNVDARSDIYSLGRVLQTLPAKAQTKQLRHIIDKCLQTDKAQRWTSVEEIKEYLNKKTGFKTLLSASVCLFAVTSLVWWAFSLPTTGEDMHVLYGQYSILDRTCTVVGKISNDDSDPNWQGNLYIRPEIRHWGMTFTVNAIADEAFMDSTSINTVFMPATLRTIGMRAFQDCHNLISIRIPDSVDSIGEAAFCRTYKMRIVKLPRSLRHIPAVCFSKSGISRIYIPDGVTDIHLDAFALCPRLSEVRLPSSIHTIERGAFWRCKELQYINIPDSVSIGEYVFDGTQIQ